VRATRREYQALVELAEAQGWEVTQNGGGHLRFQGPEGQLVFTAQTPSDHRSIKNATSFLRRAGLDVPHPQHRKKQR
jgi:predicted RNA binding protein YcfA (HicA-like mRNA interferase family)